MTKPQIASLPYRPCVGIVLINHAGLVFAGQRIDSAPGAWQMPQGGVDKGEDPAVAARRELLEETGVSADLVELLDQTRDWLPYDLPEDLVPRLWGGKYRGQEQRWFLYRFTGNDRQINIATEHPEFSDWRWLKPEEVLAAIVPFKREIYAKVFDAFAEHLA